MPGLRVDRIDPKAETQKYIDKIMAAKSAGLDAQGQALLLEDLQSPCTEEVAVFHAFSRIVSEARSAFVVLDTAPTGHSLLLMDATGAYHRQMMREYVDKAGVITPLMRLQDPQHTKIILVTLPEVTPVSQASALQDDLRRAQIEPYAWVINKSMEAAGTAFVCPPDGRARANAAHCSGPSRACVCSALAGQATYWIARAAEAGKPSTLA
jgi:arsenite-transporting ATPase